MNPDEAAEAIEQFKRDVEAVIRLAGDSGLP